MNTMSAITFLSLYFPRKQGLTGYSSPVVLVKWKNQNLYRVCSDFCIPNEKLVKINHTFPLVRDCIEQLGRKKWMI